MTLNLFGLCGESMRLYGRRVCSISGQTFRLLRMDLLISQQNHISRDGRGSKLLRGRVLQVLVFGALSGCVLVHRVSHSQMIGRWEH